MQLDTTVLNVNPNEPSTDWLHLQPHRSGVGCLTSGRIRPDLARPGRRPEPPSGGWRRLDAGVRRGVRW